MLMVMLLVMMISLEPSRWLAANSSLQACLNQSGRRSAIDDDGDGDDDDDGDGDGDDDGDDDDKYDDDDGNKVMMTMTVISA